MILGVSFDTPAEQKAFADAEGFGFRLLCDTDRAVGEAYQATKGPGEPYPMTARRITYLIDPDGRIACAYRVTDVGAHPAEVLEDLRALRGGS